MKAQIFKALPLIMLLVGCSDITDPEKAEKEFFVPAWAEGVWQFKNSTGQDVTVTLYNDGSALGSDESIGSWFFVEGSVYITWMTGWIDTIKSEHAHYEKQGFAPGVPTDSTSTNKSEAIKLKKPVAK